IPWNQRMAAVGLAKLPEKAGRVLELNAEIIACGDNWRAAKPAKDELNALLGELHHAAGGDEGKERGTQAHMIAEYAQLGRFEEIAHLVTDSEKADLEAYLQACDAAEIECPAAWVEKIVVNTEVETAGTLDRIARLRRSRRLVIADYKGQQSIDFGFLEICIQLATYANAAAMWNDEQRKWEPMPQIDKEIGIVFHCPVGSARCDVYEVDLVAGWRAAKVAHETRRLRSASKAMGRPYRPRPVSATGGDPVLYLINNAQHPDALVALWRDVATRGGWTPEYNAAAKRRKEQLLGTAA
ncbi:MAG TPA: PD-(D/E)XK nuclease family protein, partial [Alphaproteobacteria bacterium]|nr:PD-(D/E)XK nuclease family protein [Alphaproteobacteria bacterium]